MRESKFLEEIEAEAELKRGRVLLQQALEVRFGPKAVVEFADTLKNITDADRLTELHRLVLKSRGVAAFRRVLQARQS